MFHRRKVFKFPSYRQFSGKYFSYRFPKASKFVKPARRRFNLGIFGLRNSDYAKVLRHFKPEYSVRR